MNTQIKNKWLDALRSGKYEQGCDNLRTDDNEFCCLGVLCDIVDNTLWEFNDEYSYDNEVGYLPESIVVATGLDNDDPVIPNHVLQKHIDEKTLSNVYSVDNKIKLSYLNDSNISFETIANIIEEAL